MKRDSHSSPNAIKIELDRTISHAACGGNNSKNNFHAVPQLENIADDPRRRFEQKPLPGVINA